MRLPSAFFPAMALAAMSAGGAAAFDASSPGNFLASYSLAVPRGEGSRVIVCHGYGCHFRTPVGFGPAQIAEVRALLGPGAASAHAERHALRRAIAWFETLAGPIAGTSRDTPSTDLDLAGTRGEQDCIDEAVITTQFLLWLEATGAMVHHRVAAPSASGLLATAYPHITAVIEEKGSGARWAVDSWLYANGVPPIVMPLDRWLSWAGGRGSFADWDSRLKDEPPPAPPAAPAKSKAAVARKAADPTPTGALSAGPAAPTLSQAAKPSADKAAKAAPAPKSPAAKPPGNGAPTAAAETPPAPAKPN